MQGAGFHLATPVISLDKRNICLAMRYVSLALQKIRLDRLELSRDKRKVRLALREDPLAMKNPAVAGKK